MLCALIPLMGKYAGLILKISPIVTACPMPDWGLSGATTWTSPRSATASASAQIPEEVIPSSFVMSISGRFDMF